MEPVQRKRAPRYKRVVKEMIPVKKWLTLPESCSYLDMSTNIFMDLVHREGLTISVIGKKKYFRVSELDYLIEENILIHKI